MSIVANIRALTSQQRRAFLACYLGWTLDSFDFFILTWCLDSVAADFHVSLETVATSLFWTLCMRPVGALLFGIMAERYGRRRTLMINIICFSLFELSSAFAPTFTTFLITRALFGVAMGGEWGVGAALAFETLPAKGRGFFSGVLQEGYVTGNLIAAAVYGAVFPHLHGTGYLTNWRVLFMIGALPSLLVYFIRQNVEESPAWVARQSVRVAEPVKPFAERVSGFFSLVGKFLPSFLMLTIMMSAFMSFSHGTQDLYPTFLKRDMHLGKVTASWVGIISNVGALSGGIFFGTLSEKIGRRKAIVTAALLSIPMIPLWAWSHTVVLMAAGGFLMQFAVQGAWGVVPVHLNELSPGPVRAIFPGLTYQLGNLITSRNAVLQTAAASYYFGGRFSPMLTWTVIIMAALVAVTALINREAKGADLSTA